MSARGSLEWWWRKYSDEARHSHSEPSPSSRTRALPSSVRKPTTHSVSSPALVKGLLKKSLLPSRRIVEIDLTGSSDEDNDNVEILHGTIQPPIRTKPPRATGPVATPARKVVPLSPAKREALALALVRDLDRAVFRKKWDGMRCADDDGKDGEVRGLPDGLQLVWNNKLRNTAGKASWKSTKVGGVTTQITTIDLSIKVLDTEEKLRATLSHELVHVAAWTLSKELKPPHGAAFKLWAKRVNQIRPDIHITTLHSYEIAFKYRWRCLDDACAKM